MRILVIVGLYIAVGGCGFEDAYRQAKSEADIAEQRAAIMKLYRGCLEKYQDDPAKAKVNCEHYTQALYSLDVRGMK
jgi:hypothetical protein